MTTTNTDTIRVIAYREGDTWVAQCLEYDISAQGADFETAKRRLAATVNCEAQYTREKHGEAFKGIEPAPSIFAAMFDSLQESLRTDNLEYKIAA